MIQKSEIVIETVMVLRYIVSSFEMAFMRIEP